MGATSKAHDFGVIDGKGRRVGCIARIAFVESTPVRAAYFDSSIQATRDGKKYGALPPHKRHPPSATIAEVQADLAARVEASRKRYERQARGGGSDGFHFPDNGVCGECGGEDRGHLAGCAKAVA